MNPLRVLPLKYRKPLTYGLIEHYARLRALAWPDLPGLAALRPGPLIVSGLVNEPSGIGSAARYSIQALKACGLRPRVHDLRPVLAHALTGDGLFPTHEQGGVWLIHANPNEALLTLMAFTPSDWAHRYRIGYWAWETTCAPASWAWAATFFHEIWVPSRFVRDALFESFKTHGCAEHIARVRIMPHPVDLAETPKRDPLRFGLKGNACRFLCVYDVNSAQIRKNPQGAIEAWLLAFPQATDAARLTIKAHNLVAGSPEAQELNQLCATRHDIELRTEAYDHTTQLSFLASFDAVLSLHRAEGFGLNLAEAMQLGVCVIATGWSGNMDFMDSDCAYLVKSRLVTVSDQGGQYGGLFGREDASQFWAEPDVEDAARAIKQLYLSASDRKAKQIAAQKSVAALKKPWLASNMRDHAIMRLSSEVMG